MLKTRVLTAIVLLAALLSIFYSGSLVLFALVAVVFFAGAAWESARLFDSVRPRLAAVLWTAVLILAVRFGDASSAFWLFVCCVALWAIRLAPALQFGLPALHSVGNRLLAGVYGLALLGCFLAIGVLYLRGAVFLVSVMAIVWVADIGAYFFGKAFGRHKLAPLISPGKSWEGAVGGWFSVLLLAALSSLLPSFGDTFAVRVQAVWGWLGFVLVLSLIVAASIVGDLFESQLKRRAGMKDSSTLLPGHGGVLDRIDALIPVLPLATLFSYWV